MAQVDPIADAFADLSSPSLDNSAPAGTKAPTQRLGPTRWLPRGAPPAPARPPASEEATLEEAALVLGEC